MKWIDTGVDNNPAVFSYGDLIDRHLISWVSLSGTSVSVKNESELREHYDVISCCSSNDVSPCIHY